jgi:hypothetical protein
MKVGPNGPASVAALSVALLLAACFAAGASGVTARGQSPQARPVGRTHYRIDFKLDFDARTYAGVERVRWVNRDDRPASVLYFHLYPNLRDNSSAATPTPTPQAAPSAPAEPSAPDEPRLEVTAVRSVASVGAQTAQPLAFALEDAGVTLRVQLREAVAPNSSAEIELDFRGFVPEINADETSLPAHVVQQVGAALRDARETRRARDTNFASRGALLLAAFHPVLAAREGGTWQRKAELTVGDTIFADAADYEVTVETASDVRLFTSGEALQPPPSGGARARGFAAEGLRSFALVAGRTLRSAERAVGGVSVRSVYMAEHEKVGRRVLEVAADAARTYAARFGPLPFKSVTVAEAPLVAGLGSTEFSGLAVIASAFYVDFDSPAMRNLPEMIREQRASVEDSLEFAAAQGVAHQWWGAVVGSDPNRAPVLDEALAHWSALLYVQDVHGLERATAAQEDQLRGVYQIYRTFGGEDMSAERPAREFRNSFQYAAIVVSKGSLMFATLRQLLGEERFFRALRSYYEANRFEVAEMEDLRAAFVAEAELRQRRAVTRVFNRWLNERHGDEDIAPPNAQLAEALGLSLEQPGPANRPNAFSRLGRFFWRQMTRIR